MSKKNTTKASGVRLQASGKKKKSKSEVRSPQPEAHVESVEKRIEETLSRLNSLNSELERKTLDATRRRIKDLERKEPKPATRSPKSEAQSPAPDPFSFDLSVGNALDAVTEAYTVVEETLRAFQTKLQSDISLTGKERQRLFGVRSRKYGFINKTFEVVESKPSFMPPHFDTLNMQILIGLLRQSRDLLGLLEQFHKIVDDCQLVGCDLAYRDALRIYGSLREQSRGRVQGADVLFQELRQFFMLRRRPRNGFSGDGEPTMKELERDAMRLLHGKADGEMVIANKSPHTTGGVREVEVRE